MILPSSTSATRTSAWPPDANALRDRGSAFFVAGPILAARSRSAVGAQPVAALMCVGALLVVWAVTKAAHSRL